MIAYLLWFLVALVLGAWSWVLHDIYCAYTERQKMHAYIQAELAKMREERDAAHRCRANRRSCDRRWERHAW